MIQGGDNIVSRIQRGDRAGLVLAHPGHELRVFGWLSQAQPTVFVLTDGSGHTGSSRLDSTSAILNSVGATQGAVYGAFTDRDLYAAILGQDHEVLTEVVDRLAAELIEANVDYVVGDGTEGYNPGHDVCRLVIDAAVALVNRTREAPLGNFAFRLTGSPAPEADSEQHDLIRLDDRVLEQKLVAAHAYEELAGEVDAAISAFGQDVFRLENVRPASRARWNPLDESGKPFYEIHGERQVAAGHYRRVLRYREHMLPLAAALQRHVELAEDSCAS